MRSTEPRSSVVKPRVGSFTCGVTSTMTARRTRSDRVAASRIWLLTRDRLWLWNPATQAMTVSETAPEGVFFREVACHFPSGRVVIIARASKPDLAGHTGRLLYKRNSGDPAMPVFVRRIDEQVLTSRDPDLAEEAPRERLFDILFGRFEALGPYRPAIRNLGRAARRDPLLARELNRIVTNAMGWSRRLPRSSMPTFLRR